MKTLGDQSFHGGPLTIDVLDGDVLDNGDGDAGRSEAMRAWRPPSGRVFQLPGGVAGPVATHAPWSDFAGVPPVLRPAGQVL